MRLGLFILIIFFAGLIGFELKRKYIEQRNFLIYIKSFIEFLNINISIYKNNLNEIINIYLIQQNNKNAKYNKIFCKNNNLYAFNKEIIDKYIYEKDLNSAINLYLTNIGNFNVENECVKLNAINKLIEKYIFKSSEDIKSKGDLLFKICIVIGIVIVIFLW